MSWMISFAGRRLRSEEWHWAGIAVLVRGTLQIRGTQTVAGCSATSDSIAATPPAFNGESRENAGDVRMPGERRGNATQGYEVQDRDQRLIPAHEIIDSCCVAAIPRSP
jgi:hypothetical protein